MSVRSIVIDTVRAACPFGTSFSLGSYTSFDIGFDKSAPFQVFPPTHVLLTDNAVRMTLT
jgi:hypothetical protein